MSTENQTSPYDELLKKDFKSMTMEELDVANKELMQIKDVELLNDDEKPKWVKIKSTIFLYKLAILYNKKISKKTKFFNRSYIHIILKKNIHI